MRDHEIRRLFDENWGKILGGLAGLVLGLMIVIFGFWRGLFIIICVAAGVFLGRSLERNENLRNVLGRFWPGGN